VTITIPTWLLWALGIIAAPIVLVLVALGVWALWFLSHWEPWK
jgi:hypothetical protein